MKLALLSDIHGTSQTPVNRKDNLRKTFLRKFRFVLKEGMPILIAADFFDRPRDWTLLYDTIRLIKNGRVDTIFVLVLALWPFGISL